MNRTVPLAHQPHTERSRAGNGLGLGKLVELLLGLPGQTAQCPRLDLVGERQTQRRRAELRDRAAGELNPRPALFGVA
jgi:hypothetical protein